MPALVCPGVRGYSSLPVMRDVGGRGPLLRGAVVFDGALPVAKSYFSCLEPRVQVSSKRAFSLSKITRYLDCSGRVDEAGLLTYDDILLLLEQIESGRLEAEVAELEQINEFLARLAMEGALPGELEESILLAEDIDHLLSEERCQLLEGLSEGWSIEHGLFYEDYEYSLVKSKGLLQKAKEFIKRHKKEIIIGAVIVVAVAVVIAAAVLTAPAAASGAAAACAAAAAGSAEDGASSSQSMGDGASSSPPIKSSSEACAEVREAEDVPEAVSEIIDSQIEAFKESIASERFFETADDSHNGLEESGRVSGTILAHQSLEQLRELAEKQRETIRELEAKYGEVETMPPALSAYASHQMIDRQFGTEGRYGEWDYEKSFAGRSYDFRSERSFATGNLEQGFADIDRAIALDPTNPVLYLNRGVANFNAGNYEAAQNDFNAYNLVAPPVPLAPHQLAAEFAKGFTSGVYDLGESLCLFLTELAVHPVQTSTEMFQALGTLSKMACAGEWELLSETLAPEAYELITRWEVLPAAERSRQAGYLFGKYGADIVAPGIAAKALSRGAKSAKELLAVQRTLKNSEKLLLLESSAAFEATKVAEIVQVAETTITLAEEVGLTTPEIVKLKEAGTLTEATRPLSDFLINNPHLIESWQFFKKAEAALKPYSKTFMPEAEARALIEAQGIRTFPRPEGIPDNFLVRITDKGGGMEYVDPTNHKISVRVMPGKPHSPNPCQQNPYAIQRHNDIGFNKFHNDARLDSTDSHIPLEEFTYKRN